MGYLPGTYRKLTGNPPGVERVIRKKNTMKKFIFPIGMKKYYADGDDAAATAAAAADAKAAADAAAAAAAATNDPFKKLNFTVEQQEFFNRKLAEEKRATQAAQQKTIDQLKTLQNQATTTEQQRKDLEAQIKALQQQHMSKEELAKQEQQQKEQEWQRNVAQEKANGKKWETMYHESTINRALQDAAIEAEAFSPSQIIDMLYQKTKLVEEMDSQNQPTGNLIPRVKLNEYDKDGKLIVLDLTVKEALQKMKNTPEKYGNLFKSTLAGGLGQNGSVPGGRGKKSTTDMSQAEYMEARKRDPSLAFVK